MILEVFEKKTNQTPPNGRRVSLNEPVPEWLTPLLA